MNSPIIRCARCARCARTTTRTCASVRAFGGTDLQVGVLRERQHLTLTWMAQRLDKEPSAVPSTLSRKQMRARGRKSADATKSNVPKEDGLKSVPTQRKRLSE